MTASKKTQTLRNINAVALTVSLVILGLVMVWTFSPHVSHRIFAFITGSSPSNSAMFYDGTLKNPVAEVPATTPATNTLPDTGGCGCPSCCAPPAS